MTKEEKKKVLERKRHAKYMMKMNRPLKGYLGNEFHMWENIWNNCRKLLGEIA